MPSLHDLEKNILEMEGINVSLDGPDANYKPYWKTAFNEKNSVTEFKIGLNRRYPNIEIIVFDGIGRVASGRYLLKNLRKTCDFTWIQETYEETVCWLREIIDDKYKEIEKINNEIIDVKGVKITPIITDPYEILGVDKKISDADLKKILQKKISGLHPDKIDKMDDLLKKFATEKIQEINAAFDEIKKLRRIDNTTVD